MDEVTQILEAIQQGDSEAAEKLLPAVYDDLRKVAARKLAAHPPGSTLQATALVHEAYLRLLGPDGEAKEWDHRGHFFMAAAQAMRNILVDRVRRKQRVKHGGEHQRVDMEEADLRVSVPDGQLLDLDEALKRLAEKSPKEAELVNLRFFAGLTLEEAAEVLGVSRATATRYWAFARAWLFKELGEDCTLEAGEPGP